MSKKIKNNIEQLTVEDTYSLILFALYQLKNIPECSTLSELSYILDKQDLLKLINHFGGQTITIPTLEDLKLVANCLLLVQYVNCDGLEFNVALNKLGITDLYKIEDIKKVYFKLNDILTKYNFHRV